MSWKSKQAVVKINIYVAGLPRNYDTAALKMLFSVFGTVSRSKVILPEDETKHAYGFVSFSDAQCAEEAIKGLNGCVLNANSRRLIVRFASNNPYEIEYKQPEENNYLSNERLHVQKGLLYQRNNFIPTAPKRSPPSPPLANAHRLNQIKEQIEYYFSVENMNTDDFLRRAMDKKGWVTIDTLLRFNRLKEMHTTKDELIEVANSSQTIEVEKLRMKLRMTFWKQYIPCYELQCSYDTIKQKYESHLRTDAPKISHLQSENERKDQMIKQLQSQHDKRIQSVQQKYKQLQIQYDDIGKEYESVQKQCIDFWEQQQSVETENKQKDQLIKHLKEENNQLKFDNNNLKNMQKQYENLQTKYNESRNQERIVCGRINKLEDEHKELQMRYSELEAEYNEKIKKLDYTLWDATHAVQWIIDLDKKYKKYYNDLLQNMINEGIDGSCLPDLNRNDLHRLGITQFKDKRDIYDNLQQLIHNKNEKPKNNQQNEGMINNTAFM